MTRRDDTVRLQKDDYLKKVFEVKKVRRKELANLPFPEKLRIWLKLKAFFNSGWRAK